VITHRGLGTLMRHVLELLDGDVARVYADLGVPDYRPRYSPVVRALVALGPLSIRDPADRPRPHPAPAGRGGMGGHLGGGG
jgi:hypothetical protein